MDTLRWLEASPVGTLVRESLYGFPIIVSLHILGLVMSVGTLLWFDLRLVGLVLTDVPISRVYRRLIPWAACGFVAMAVTGLLLFTGYATAAAGNAFFRLKGAAMLLAGANAACYHLVTERTASKWDAQGTPPTAARAAGLISMVLWTLVVLCGRIMAYTMY